MKTIGEDEEIPTLDFDRNDLKKLKILYEDLEVVKEEHGRYIALLGENPRNIETIRECKRLRLERTRINDAIALIPEKIVRRRGLQKQLNRRWPE